MVVVGGRAEDPFRPRVIQEGPLWILRVVASWQGGATGKDGERHDRKRKGF